MGKQTTILLFLILILSLVPDLVHNLTLPSDIQALRALHDAIDPGTLTPSTFLNTWDFSLDPCDSIGKFLGIVCSYPADNSSSRVKEIHLDGKGYDGFLTPTIGNLTELTFLDLSRNQFLGQIPESLFNLKKLTWLSLAKNFFTGNISPSIAQLRLLTKLDLSANRLSGSIPPGISAFRSLAQLNLSSNLLTGKIPSLNGLWQLRCLDLGSNQFIGPLPRLPTSLRTLILSHNTFSGSISPILSLNQLVSLDLSDNRLFGTIEHQIFQFPAIRRVNLSFNHFTSLVVNKFTGQESHLRVLDAEENLLRGHLPANLITLGALIEINLSNNRFIGSIPKAFGSKMSRSWKRLYLNNNYLIGNLPPDMSNSATNIEGSLAKNCLHCPDEVRLCRGGQKSEVQCRRYLGGYP